MLVLIGGIEIKIYPPYRPVLKLRRLYDHLRFMDFSVLPGKLGYYLWKFGIINFWQRFILKRYHLPKENTKVQS